MRLAADPRDDSDTAIKKSRMRAGYFAKLDSGCWPTTEQIAELEELFSGSVRVEPSWQMAAWNEASREIDPCDVRVRRSVKTRVPRAALTSSRRDYETAPKKYTLPHYEKPPPAVFLPPRPIPERVATTEAALAWLRFPVFMHDQPEMPPPRIVECGERDVRLWFNGEYQVLHGSAVVRSGMIPFSAKRHLTMDDCFLLAAESAA
jgi:hypothetical protein